MNGIRVLIAEDNFVVAKGLAALIGAYGGETVGMAPSIAQALRMAADEEFDVAVLDINLRGASVAPVADDLVRRGKPFVFVSGYGETDSLPERLRRHRHLTKPVEPSHMLAEILAAATGSA